MRRPRLGIGVLVAAVTVAATFTAGVRPAAPAVSAGKLLKVMTIGDFRIGVSAEQAWPLAVRAVFARAISTRGAVDDTGRSHFVRVLVCNTAFDPTRAEMCAQRAVDRNVAAVVGMATLDSDRVWPVLERAGIPVLGARVTSASDATSPVSYPIGPGLPGVVSGLPRLAAARGARTIGVVVSDLGPGTFDAVALVRASAATSGVAVTRVLAVADDDDPAKVAQTMRDARVDSVVLLVFGPAASAMYHALDDAGFARGVVVPAPVGAANLPVSEMSDGTGVVSEFRTPAPQSAEARDYAAELGRAGIPSAALTEDGTRTFWLAARLFLAALAHAPGPERDQVRRSLDAAQAFDLGSMVPPYSAGTGPAPYVRVSNPTVSFATVEGGELEPVSGDPVEIFGR